MKTYQEFMNEAAKPRVVGTFKKDPLTKVTVTKAKFGGMTRLKVSITDQFGKQTIKTGLDLKLTDKEIADEIKNGSWAKNFKKAGGVNWVK